MSLTIRETFRVDASVDRVWAFLNSPAEVVTCLPGAELVQTIDADTHEGLVRVKVGPMSTAYAGRATLTARDEANHRVQIVGEGKESGGTGSAKLSMLAGVAALPDGGSEVSIDATIDIAGRVMQFGRGLIESVSQQLFAQFVTAAQQRLAVPASAVGVGETDAGAAPELPATPPTAAAPRPVRELRALPLLWNAVVAWIKRLFGIAA